MGYVYLLQSLANKNLFKIGCSNRINNRLKTLQNTSAGGVKLIYLIACKDHYKEESHLKNMFKNKQINGEWYDLIRVCYGIISYKIIETIGIMYEDKMVYGKKHLDKVKELMVKYKSGQIKLKSIKI